MTKKQTAEDKSRLGIQVISRAANILRALEQTPTGMSLGQIAKAVDLPRSTVQRIIYSLEKERFVISASPTAKVRLGPTLVSLGSAAKFDIDRLIKPYLAELAESLGETVDLSVQDGDHVFFIDQASVETHRLKAASLLGQSAKLHACANGKAILSSLTDDEISAYVEQPIEKYTRNTITKDKDLVQSIKKVRSEGVAYDLEEHHEGICAIGTLIADPYGRKIAVSIPVPSIRFYGNESKLKRALLDAKLKIEKALGHIPN